MSCWASTSDSKETDNRDIRCDKIPTGKERRHKRTATRVVLAYSSERATQSDTERMAYGGAALLRTDGGGESSGDGEGEWRGGGETKPGR